MNLKPTEIDDKIIAGNLWTDIDITDHLPKGLLLGTPLTEAIKKRPMVRIFREKHMNYFNNIYLILIVG